MSLKGKSRFASTSNTRNKFPAQTNSIDGFDSESSEGSCSESPADIWGDDIPIRKIPHQNIVRRLMDREYGHYRPGTLINKTRKFHTNVFPNFSACNVDKPPCFLRKFTPDGRYFIAFSADQTSLEFYQFLGSCSAEHLLKDYTEDITDEDQKSDTKAVRKDLFDTFFQLSHVTPVAKDGEQLNRECSLFTDDGRFVIVGSAAFVSENATPDITEIQQNNESLTTLRVYVLENITIHIVDIKTGRHCDSRHFSLDKIFLSHNQGLSLFKNTLAVLSIQQQTIHVFQITSDGNLIDARQIGRFCYEDDMFLLQSVHDSFSVPPHKETPISSLKHRLLVHMYKTACYESENESVPTSLQRFYQQFPDFCKLRIWKMQLLDENHLFIKYAGEELVNTFVVDPNAQPTFYVIYDMAEAKVLDVFRNTSSRLLDLLESECDSFRNAALACESRFVCSPASSAQARLLQQRFKQTIVNARFGGQTEAVRRLLAHLPISAQSFSTSPYLDLELFSYDDKWVSVMERPKSCGDYPIR